MQTGGLSSFPMAERMASRFHQMGPYSTEKKADYLLLYQPHAFIISPAYLTRMQAIFEERGLQPRQALPQLKAIFIAGESYTVDWAERSMAFWGVNISEWYGLMQGGLNLCFSCETGILQNGQRGHLHAMEHRMVCEILRPGTNEPVEPGEEGMPVTHLRHVQPPGQRLLQALPVLDPVGLDLGQLFLRLAALGIGVIADWSRGDVRVAGAGGTVPAAEATLDCRLLPGVNVQEFISEMRARINDPRVTVELLTTIDDTPASSFTTMRE
jgi:hypothetical protein